MQTAAVADLLRAAHQARATGRVNEALRLWERVIELHPDHPQALFQLGQEALRLRNAAQARIYLQAAAQAAPAEPTIQLSLAVAFRMLGDADGEWRALESALKIDPYFFPARLAQGAALEKSGKKRRAARVYRDAIAAAPPDEQLAPELKSGLARAREVVADNQRALEVFLAEKIDDTRRLFENASLNRFDECRDAALGKAKIYTQQPHMLHFPKVPAITFYDNAEFPWLKKLEDATDMIRDELITVMREDAAKFKPYLNHAETQPLEQWSELNRSERWSAFYLWRDGARVEDQAVRCPKTTALLESLPMLDMPGYGPTFLFSVLSPHTHIPPHTGDTNVRLVIHLPLIVPGQCRFRVGNDVREWELGKAWIFDDTIEHEAWNDSGELRVILMCDVWNPYLTEAERASVGALLNGLYDYYDDPR